MVWLIFPENQSIYACTLATQTRLNIDIYELNMTITGGDVLPNFQIALNRIFPKE
jgi:hypothetical protein